MVALRIHLIKRAYRLEQCNRQRGHSPGHAGCFAHVLAMSSWHDYNLNKEHATSVANHLYPARQEEIHLNQYCLLRVPEVTLLCSFHEIALQGHNESSVSLKGHFAPNRNPQLRVDMKREWAGKECHILVNSG